MINVSNAEHDKKQLPDDNKPKKFYQRGDIFQIRLTKWRDDVRELLNEKKSQGADLSDYITNLIRTAEGLTDPLAAYNERTANAGTLKLPEQTNPAQVQLSPEQLEQVIKIVMERVSSSGLTVTPGEKPHELPKEKAQAEINEAINSLLDWD